MWNFGAIEDSGKEGRVMAGGGGSRIGSREMSYMAEFNLSYMN